VTDVFELSPEVREVNKDAVKLIDDQICDAVR